VTVRAKVVVGHSVDGRRITAYHLGEHDRKRVVLISVMHGNEPAPRRILMNLIHGAPVHGIDLWVVPVYNPDGLARHMRRNDHGVDLNRNYPYKWIRQGGSYDSGPKPRSEPETRAMMRFLTKVHPAYVLSFHQPLHAVDVTDSFDRGVASLAAHSDYLNGLGDNDMSDPEEFLEAMARPVGAQIGVRFGVDFEVVSI